MQVRLLPVQLSDTGALILVSEAVPYGTRKHEMNLKTFSVANRVRCESHRGFNHALDSWSLSDWMTATLGELGEAANIAKKLNRIRDGITGNKETEDQLRLRLRQEIADTFIYLDLMAQSEGIILSDAVIETFNAKSAEINCPVVFKE